MDFLSGNDTIDRYPPACREIEKILCISDRIFKAIQQDWCSFLRQFKPVEILKPKAKKMVKIKKNTEIMLAKNHYELINDPESIHRSYNHRVGRLNDWYHTYGQGMYED